MGAVRINKSHGDSMFSCDEAIPYPTGVSEDDCSSGEFLEKVGSTVVSNQMQGILNFLLRLSLGWEDATEKG